ncbi:hypothetical protein [Bryobacter aggregatus]|uniref:hypothetical protein n=1 Tax=Bryobacter aggregatus TaxID=360054 RepID=UPI0004E16ED1|nr:hypothetical protein [Bryobacter aggregatus]
MQNSVSLLCAVRGPLMLITLGTLMAIDHAGGVRFSRTWPVLIIIFGLLKLGEFLKGGQPQ